MDIGILGGGQVGRALATGWARHGHRTRIGTRDPGGGDLAAWASTHGVEVDTFGAVAQWCEAAALCTRGTATDDVVRGLPPGALDGKVLIDVTNPLGAGERGPSLAISGEDSLGERVQAALPAARVVKAYNIVGNTLMVDPDLPGGPPTMFLAGNDDDAKRAVTDLLERTGWEAVDLGGIEASRWLEAMCMAWVAYGVRTGTWQHAFKLLRA